MGTVFNPAMDVDDWLGVGCIIAGAMAFVVSLITLYNLKNCKLNDHYKLDTALMWGSLFLSLGSFVPQLVRNESLKSEIDDSISLFVPIIGPLIILTRVCRLTKDLNTIECFILIRTTGTICPTRRYPPLLTS